MKFHYVQYHRMRLMQLAIHLPGLEWKFDILVHVSSITQQLLTESFSFKYMLVTIFASHSCSIPYASGATSKSAFIEGSQYHMAPHDCCTVQGIESNIALYCANYHIYEIDMVELYMTVAHAHKSNLPNLVFFSFNDQRNICPCRIIVHNVLLTSPVPVALL